MMKIENLQAKPWYVRLAIFGGLALLVYVGFWHFVTSSTRAETKVINEQVAQLLPRNAQAQIASQRLNEFRAELKSRQEEYEELKALLPEQRELTHVLQGIQERAHTTNLTLRRFMPKDDFQQDFYSGKKIEVGVHSSFANLRAFFDQMAKYQRIVSITNFDIKQTTMPIQGKTVDANFDLTAYYVSAEKLQKSAPTPATSTATPNQSAPAPASAAASPAAPAK